MTELKRPKTESEVGERGNSKLVISHDPTISNYKEKEERFVRRWGFPTRARSILKSRKFGATSNDLVVGHFMSVQERRFRVSKSSLKYWHVQHADRGAVAFGLNSSTCLAGGAWCRRGCLSRVAGCFLEFASPVGFFPSLIRIPFRGDDARHTAASSAVAALFTVVDRRVRRFRL